jgi:hypothetical protein
MFHFSTKITPFGDCRDIGGWNSAYMVLEAKIKVV